MIEHFPEPEEKKPVAECIECEAFLHEGDIVVNVPAGYICRDCWQKAALKYATKEEMKEFIQEYDDEKNFGKWYYEPNMTVLGEL